MGNKLNVTHSHTHNNGTPIQGVYVLVALPMGYLDVFTIYVLFCCWKQCTFPQILMYNDSLHLPYNETSRMCHIKENWLLGGSPF